MQSLPSRPCDLAYPLRTLAANHTAAICSVDDLAADTFESDQELAEFLVFTYAERHRDMN